MFASGPSVCFGCYLSDMVIEDPKTDVAFGILYLRLKLRSYFLLFFQNYVYRHMVQKFIPL